MSPSVSFASYPNLAFAPSPAGLDKVNEAAPGPSMGVEPPLPCARPWPLMPVSLLPLRWGCRGSAPSGSRESAATEVALQRVRATRLRLPVAIARPSCQRRALDPCRDRFSRLHLASKPFWIGPEPVSSPAD
jgi:hypothetical protein